MTDDGETVRSIAWLELFPSLHLFKALRIALRFRALLLAALGIIFTVAGWQTCTKLFWDSSELTLQGVLEKQAVGPNLWPWERQVAAPRIDELTSAEGVERHAPLLFAWREVSRPFERLFHPEASLAEFAYWFLCALWSLAVWALFGGMITRLAAVSFARQENQSWQQLAAFVRPHWGAFFKAPLFPVLGTFLVAAMLALVGLVMRAQWGVLAGGLLWPLVLLGGFVMAFLLVGLFVGWPLMWATISAEGTDEFGALSHSYSYAYQRPLHYLLYVLAAALIGLLGWYLIWIFAGLTLALAQWGVSWGTGEERLLEIVNRSDMGPLGNAGTALVQFWNGAIVTLALAFAFSYFWTASTIIYFLLRQQVDNTEMDAVHMPEEQQLHGLPPLKTGADGVPEPADESARVE
jgi:hypothetical protein